MRYILGQLLRMMVKGHALAVCGTQPQPRLLERTTKTLVGKWPTPRLTITPLLGKYNIYSISCHL